MNKYTFFLTLSFLACFTINLSAQSISLPCVEKSTKNVVESNYKNILKLVEGKTETTKILVLPFYDEKGAFCEISNDVARNLCNFLQGKLQRKTNIVVFTDKEFSDKTGNSKLKGYTVPEGNQEAYYKELLEKIKPNFYIEGFFFINTKSTNEKVFQLKAMSCKSYFLDANTPMKKISFTDVTVLMTSEDIVADAQTPGNLWAKGTGSNFEKAGKNAMDNLLSKLSSEMESKFLNLLSTDENDIKKLSESIIRTYANAAMQKAQTKIITEEPGKTEVLKYLKQSDVIAIFDDRKSKIIDLINSAKAAKQKNQISDAIRYNYWALGLLRTHPDYDKIKYQINGSELTLITALPDLIRQLLGKLSFNIKNVVNSKEDNSKTVMLEIKYNNSIVENLDYKYYTGTNYSPISSSSNGLAPIEYYGEAANMIDKVKLMIEYEFIDKSKIDYEINTVLKNTNIPYFSEAVKIIPLGKVKETESNSNKTSSNNNNTSSSLTTDFKMANNVDSVDVYKNTLNIVLQSIATKKYAGAAQCFTKEGLAIFNRLMKYGKAKILPSTKELMIASTGNETFVRSIPMKFDFTGKAGGRSFTEDVVFTFNKDKKIDNITFSLGTKSVGDINKMKQWPDDDKMKIIQFMENYKTAYALEDTNYIESIFADNALIIIGKVLKKAETIEGMYAKLKNQDIKYVHLTKQEYISNLKTCFKNNEFVNIQFEDNTVEKRDPQSQVYGIQIKQNYYSSNYADQGYLFLMIDLGNKAEPKIYVRSWQPEKNADGSIMGVNDFTY